jgi:hypothetical protein
LHGVLRESRFARICPKQRRSVVLLSSAASCESATDVPATAIVAISQKSFGLHDDQANAVVSINNEPQDSGGKRLPRTATPRRMSRRLIQASQTITQSASGLAVQAKYLA